MKALGLIETYGLVAAIEGADAMLKAAEVCLLEQNLVGAGLVTITVTGEVSAVQAAVAAGAAAIERLGDGVRLIACHVIARPDADVATVLRLVPPALSPEPEAETTKLSEPELVVEEVAQPRRLDTEVPHHSPAQLKKMSVGQLRHLAQHLAQHLGVLDEATLALAGKKALMDAIIEVYRHGEEQGSW